MVCDFHIARCEITQESAEALLPPAIFVLAASGIPDLAACVCAIDLGDNRRCE